MGGRTFKFQPNRNKNWQWYPCFYQIKITKRISHTSFVLSYKWLGLSFSEKIIFNFIQSETTIPHGDHVLKKKLNNFCRVPYTHYLCQLTNHLRWDVFLSFNQSESPMEARFFPCSRQMWKCQVEDIANITNHIDLQIQRRFFKFLPIRKRNYSWLQCFCAESGQNEEFLQS